MDDKKQQQQPPQPNLVSRWKEKSRKFFAQHKLLFQGLSLINAILDLILFIFICTTTNQHPSYADVDVQQTSWPWITQCVLSILTLITFQLKLKPRNLSLILLVLMIASVIMAASVCFYYLRDSNEYELRAMSGCNDSSPDPATVQINGHLIICNFDYTIFEVDTELAFLFVNCFFIHFGINFILSQWQQFTHHSVHQIPLAIKKKHENNSAVDVIQQQQQQQQTALSANHIP